MSRQARSRVLPKCHIADPATGEVVWDRMRRGGHGCIEWDDGSGWVTSIGIRAKGWEVRDGWACENVASKEEI